MTIPIDVLMVEDSPTDAKLVLRELERGGRSVTHERVETAEAMRAALERRSWDVIISDWSLPKFSAPAALSLVKELGLDVPFIIVSGTVGEEHAVAAMRAGAQDYVLKDHLKRLAPAVEREIRERDERRAHRQAEIARHEAERRMRQMIDSAMVGVWFFDAEGKTTFMNRRMAAILGFELEEAIHAPVTDFIDRQDWPGLSERMSQRRAGFSGSYEHKFRRKDGTVGWGILESTPLYDADGRFEGILSVVTDITDRKTTQQAQREAELRFARLAEAGIIGIVVSDLHGNILDANDEYLRTVGYSRDELVAGAVRWRDLTPVEFRELADQAAQELQETGIARSWETETFRKDGSRVPVTVGVAMLEYPKCIAFTIDLTDRKRAEVGRQRAEHALQRSEEQLRQAQKMEAVGRLAGGVAHDFNNMLSVILSYGEMLLSDLRPSDPMRHDVEEICKAGRRAADLTRQLLMFSRQQVTEPRILDLSEVLTSMDRMLHRIMGEDVALVTSTVPGLGHVRADRSGVEQVIMNLAVNARDAMPTGGKLTIELTNVVLDDDYVSSHVSTKPGSYVMLAVTDTGCGMDKETQARIFEPFFTTKGVGKGTGLGLSTVFGIVQQSEGNIWVYSEPNRGTTFKIYLPRLDSAIDAPRQTSTSANLRGSETVLVVEDEEAVRAIVSSVLRRHGYRVLAAGNAGEAILLCETRPTSIELLLTDVVMPEMSGPELVQRLAEIRPDIKVLYMSGYTDDSIVRHGILESGVAFLQKPLTPGSLTRKVREVLDSPAPQRRS